MTRNDSTGIALRPAVLWFAEQMELKLRENDHKGGWEDCDDDYLLERLEEETDELREALAVAYKAKRISSAIRDAIAGESADVANFALMLAHNWRQ